MQIKTLADILTENKIQINDRKDGNNDRPNKALTTDFFQEDYPSSKLQGQNKKPTYNKNKNSNRVHKSPRQQKTKPAHQNLIKTSNSSCTHNPIKPVNIKPVNIKPVNIKPVNIKPVNIKPVNIKPVNIKPVNIKPLDSKPLDIKSILQQVKTENANRTSATTNHNLPDNLTKQLKQGLKTAEQRQAEIDEIKSDSRLRWLAFYYLSVREHSASELKTKLLAKNQDPDKVDALLTEFAEKGYQSEMRTALMLIRSSIRKGRGRRRIEQDFFKHKLAVPNNIDELIDLANSESDEFAEYVDNQNGTDKIDWLSLAVEARVKKYGNDIPTNQKEKAKQLRFLQYRGFKTDICFEALKHDLQSLTN